MLSLWYLQAALSDLASTPNTPTFDTCRRVLNQVQAVIFADLVAPKPASSASPAASLLGLKPKKKLKPHAKASIAGLGVLASAIAMPALAQTLGPMALAQGRRELEPDHSALFSDQHQHQPVAGPSRHSSDEEDLLESGSRTQFVDAPKTLMSSKSHAALSGGPPLSRSSAAVRPSPLSATRTRFSADHPPRKALTPVSFTNSPSSPALDRTSTSNSSAANRRMVSASTSSLPMPASHSISVPSLPLKDPAPNGPLDVQRALATIPQETLSHLLRSHSCRAQLDLVSSLQDISTRLVNVPKPARVSALRAELTVLNHGLPRGCCIGIICSHSRSSEPHHRVVRICPSESVVLNSADRAPYLIHVEVLEGDLDFDPTRRQNVEDVRHVLQEREEAIAKASSREIHFTSPLPAASQQPSAKSPATVAARSGRAIAQATKGLTLTMKRKGNVDSVDVGEARTPPLSAASATSFTARHASLRPSSLDMPSAEDDGDLGIAISEPQSEERDTRGSDEPMEEMDMVEQLYGDTSLIPEPIAFEGPTLHNRSLDEEAWSRIDSSSHKPNAPPESPELPSAAPAPHSPSKKPITLDEYADRMRMAAIMLSQLSAQENDAALLSSSSVFGLAGAGYEAVRGRLPFVSSKVPTSAAGQGSTGIPAKIDLEGAASGHSSVQGTGSMSPPPAHPGTFNANAIAPSPANTTTPKAKVLSPIETAAIRERIMQEMQALEDERMARMRHDSKARASGWTSGHAPQAVSSSVEDPSLVLSLANKDDPSGVVLSESWPEKIARIRASSPYGHLERWNVFSVIVKTGTDLRQEQLATQLIREFERVWSNAGCPHWLR